MFDYARRLMTVLPLTLFGSESIAISPSPRFARVDLDECCWVDVARGYLLGADRLFIELEEAMAWHRGRRLMYGTWYDEPRLTATEPRPCAVVPPAVDAVRADLTQRYRRRYDGLFCNLYEDGDDSVAWHADRIGRTEIDPLVAILSLGGPRTFALRPFGGGVSQRIGLHSGDLLVMGGATQHHWEHAIPKTRHAAPRMSVTMRAGAPPFA